MPKTTVADTSLKAFQQKKPELEGDRKKVYKALKQIGPAIGEEVAQHLEVPYHTISGRFSELEEQDMIETKGQKQNPRGYMAQIWKVKK